MKMSLRTETFCTVSFTLPAMRGVLRETFQNYQTVFGHAALPPARFEETVSGLGAIARSPSRICAPDLFRMDLGVMPLTRPAVISDGVSLSDKLGREERTFVSKDGALDPVLLRDGVVDVVSPNKEGISSRCAQDDAVAGTNELESLAAIFVLVCAVMSFI
jgi:hypothetical protein